MTGCVARHAIYKNYGAREDGTILNLKTLRTLNPSTIRTGYQIIGLYLNGKQKFFLVHRFVYECFRGDIPPHLEVDHLDNDRTNNRLDNLQLLTHLQNCRKTPIENKLKCGMKPLPLISICIETGERVNFPSINAAARELNVNKGRISSILEKHQKSSQSKTNGLWYKFEKV